MSEKLIIENCIIYKSENYVCVEIEHIEHKLSLVDVVSELIGKGYKVATASELKVYLSK